MGVLAACGVEVRDERPDSATAQMVLRDPDDDGLYASPGCDGSEDGACVVLPGPPGCEALLVTTTGADRCVACLDEGGVPAGPVACAPAAPSADVACAPDPEAASEGLACWSCENGGARYSECVPITAPRASLAPST